MAQIERALVQEFIRLRHGWGLAATNLRARIGPHLTELCGIVPGDNDRAIRLKVLTTVRRLTAGFTPEDRLAADIALGEAPGAQHRLLGSRIEILAQRLRCAERTARRRVERAIERLAEEAVAQRSMVSEEPDDDPEKGWHVRRLEALLRLDTAGPELTETRTIVALRDNLRKIAIRFSLPQRDDTDAAARDLTADVQYGAQLETMERQGSAHFRFLLKLPKALARDEAHTYTMVFRVPAGQQIRSHYAFVPLVHCDSFVVRIRYHPLHPPAAVWRLHQLAPRALSDAQTPGEPLPLDDANEVMLEFDRMKLGFGYGIAWKMND